MSPDSLASSQYASRTDAELRELALNPPSDLGERAALRAELQRRAEGQRAEPRPSTQQVAITDVDMPFWSMVRFMVKWAVASIPAFVILFIIAFLITIVLAGFLGGLGRALIKT